MPLKEAQSKTTSGNIENLSKFEKKSFQSFSVNILEKGIEYKQDIDLDDEGNTVTVHVPGHRDIDETYFITDSKKVPLFKPKKLHFEKGYKEIILN